jgi:hypothetical protein
MGRLRNDPDPDLVYAQRITNIEENGISQTMSPVPSPFRISARGKGESFEIRAEIT